MYYLILFLTCWSNNLIGIYGQHHQAYTTPIPILKQIDRQNADGSYTYGYEGADKSFKIETKYPNGEVYGKYGYVDDQGNLREIEYGASKRGFEPAGSDINVPPPTLISKNSHYLNQNDIDDGQYHEDPSIYYNHAKYNRPKSSNKLNSKNIDISNNRQPIYNHEQTASQDNNPLSSYPYYYNDQYDENYIKPQRLRIHHQNKPRLIQSSQYELQPQYQHQAIYHQARSPAHSQYNLYNSNNQPQYFHPAIKSLDIWSGSYSLDYNGRK